MKAKNFKPHQVLFFTALLSLAACNNAGNNANNMADTVAARVDTAMKDIKQGAENAAGEIKNALEGNPDSNFVVKATTANMEELKILQAGLDNGTDKELKAHAKMMIADHKKLGAKVKGYSGKKGYALPADDNGKGDDAVAALNKKTRGKDWDKAWADKMVDGHNDAISLFEKYQDKVKDADLKTMITETLPTLHAHLDMMKQLQDKMGK